MEYKESDTSITFSYKHEGFDEFPKTEISHTIDGDVPLIRVCEAFENFLYSCGYRFGKGEKIGIVEYD
jgi:hypothetical protein